MKMDGPHQQMGILIYERVAGSMIHVILYSRAKNKKPEKN